MSPSFDDVSSAGFASGTDINVSHTKGASANIVICVYFGRGSSASPPTVSSVTYDSDITPTLIKTRSQDRLRCTMYEVENPRAGARPFRVLSSGAQSQVIAQISYNGVNSGLLVTSTDNAGGTSTDPSYTIQSATGRLVIDAIATNNQALILGSDQVLRLDTDSGNPTTVVAGISEEVGAASVTMDWLLASSAIWAMTVADLSPQGGNYGFIL